uniref:CSON005991 protein n=1 Tax=Culicoides sonorensis TaxID=179676 RepID=A0A336LVK5_CULSO
MKLKRSIPILELFLIFITILANVETHSTEAEHKKYVKYIKTGTDEKTQSAAALDVIYRTIPEYGDYFRVQINFSLPSNYYEVDANVPMNGVVKIVASSGVAAVRGFYDYLRNVHKAQVAWEGKNIKIKSINDIYFKKEEADSEFIYFQNVCTFSYSYVWWKFEDWRRHIDWIAMHGINLVLAPFQEDVWNELYKEIGLKDEEIKEHFTGPAFYAWLRMGNLRGWASVPYYFAIIDFLKYSSQLQQKVIYEFQRLGINFAIPSFAGHVPVAFQRIYPNTTFQKASEWVGFPEKYCCPFLIDPTDPLFTEIGTKFLNKMIAKYGTSHIYFADPFNELVPHTNEPEYLANVSQAIYNVMESVDPEAVWLLQGWMFYNAANFWKDAQIKAFLTAIPIGKILVLDLHSDMFPQYEKTKSYYGQPFIWNMLHNFGGNLGMRGSAALIADRARATFNDPNMTMIGLGITPEGINQNHIIYEFALDLAWIGKEPFNTVNWFKLYGEQRHGVTDNPELWNVLHNTIYNYNGTKRIDGIAPYLVVDSPSLNHNPWSWFHPDNIKFALTNILSITVDENELFNYDVVDFTRQFLQNNVDLQYILIMDGFKNGIQEKVKYHSKLFLNMVFDMDRILSCNENFLLGKWLDAANSISRYYDQFEFNARNQITLWGPNGEINNYAIKQWAGLIQDYVLPRWKLFWNELALAMDNHTLFDEIAVRKRIFNEIESPFGTRDKSYPITANCEPMQVAKEILNKYKNLYIGPEVQSKAAYDLICRTIDCEVYDVEVTVIESLPKNYYEIKANLNQITINASSEVAATRGFYDYIRKYHNSQVAWEGNHIEITPIRDEIQLHGSSDSEYVYFQNVCTFGYSYVWWKFEDWRKHIDWIALHGINLVLAPFQEDIWRDLYRKWGMTDKEIAEHFAGPAFLPWMRMGNFRGWGGPLSDNFMNFSSKLQQQIINEYQKLGIKFALPSFAGHVPVAFKRIFPDTEFKNTSHWMGFPSKNCCPLFLDPSNELFQEIGTQFLSSLIEKYGTSHVYFADPFNELTPSSNSPEYLKGVSQGIFNVMKSVDKDAIWLMQGWMFFNGRNFWRKPQMKAFLTANPIGKMLILDLHSDQFPQYERTKSYFGQPFIWCMLHNFGGNIGMHGAAPLIADRARNAFNNQSLTMVGLGITPEGINQNHVMYEFALDLAWNGKSRLNTRKWFTNYGARRYGRKWKSNSWSILHDTVYNYDGLRLTGGIAPNLVVDTPRMSHKPWSYFHPNNLSRVIEEFLSYQKSLGPLFDYDLVDLTRQYLQNMIDLQYIAIIEGHKNEKFQDVYLHSKIFLCMIQDMEEILKTNENFLLGKWLNAAKSLAATSDEAKLFEFNARNQITLWGPNGEINNYAMKQWSGIVSDYIYPRWEFFLKKLMEAMKENRCFNENAVLSHIRKKIELPFNNSTKLFSDKPEGNTFKIAHNIFNRYRNIKIDQKWIDQYLNGN